MKKLIKNMSKFFVALLAMSLVCSPLFGATVSSDKQLAKAKQLYAQHKDDEAMDLFIDVLVTGNRAEVEEANKYINLIHNHMGGIQTPVEVDVDFKEGETTRLQEGQDSALLEQHLQDSLQNGEEIVDADTARQINEASLTGDAEALYVQQHEQELESAAAAATAAANNEAEAKNSTYTDLVSPAALQARSLYTEQKLDSMLQAVIARLEKTKGVHLYFRNGWPDAIDIDSEVLFNGYKFRSDAYPILDDVYSLMALTQGAGYIILPPGSYTDDITLPGIRQAMALNSFLVHKGLSSGKISYNMGLFDQEPPAKFANLEGLSIVFDYEAELPAALPEAASVNYRPMLSMAVVPVSNKIDLMAGEAFAVDFSVLETAESLDNWVFQVVQHASDGQYYIVRQLDGFSPVYHQLLWNARKGIIGPALACGKYTFALTATDIKGVQNTLRRQVEVVCPEITETKDDTAKKLNYKAARLWKKPGRVMKSVVNKEEVATAEPEVVDPFGSNSSTHTETHTYYNELPDGSVETQTTTTTTTTTTGTDNTDAGVNNPYDMPEDFGDY